MPCSIYPYSCQEVRTKAKELANSREWFANQRQEWLAAVARVCGPCDRNSKQKEDETQ